MTSSSPLEVAFIGLDTSHTVVFSQRMNDPACPEEEKVPGLHARRCLRFPSPFQSEEEQDERQSQIEGWGVEVTRDFDEAVDGCDVIMVEINDPTLHLDYFERAAVLGKPVFIDKPLADTLDNGRRIVELARENNLRFWSSSSLRFVEGLAKAREQVPEPLCANFFGPLGKAAAGSDIVWYGVHSVEMMAVAMGTGASSVIARKDPQGAVAHVGYSDGRRGVVEFNESIWTYGGRLAAECGVASFEAASSSSLYNNLLAQMRSFFQGGDPPVPVEETLEVQAILDAIERSLSSGQEVALEI